MEHPNIIFDLGNVLLPIDETRPVKAFKKLGLKDFDKMYTLAAQNALFDDLEKGHISPGQFRENLRTLSGLDMTDAEIDEAWNSIILDFRPETMKMLEQLAAKTRLFLLSNTNAIHFAYYDSQVRKRFHRDGLNAYFEKVFYSHETGFRKPEAGIFHIVLERTGLKAEDCLFVDDNPKNIEVASSLGFGTLFHPPRKKIENLF